jgi:hypothetical protein
VVLGLIVACIVAAMFLPSWPAQQIGSTAPNYRAGVDAGFALIFALVRDCPGTTQHGCSTT